MLPPLGSRNDWTGGVSCRRQQSGYILITLMLGVALVTIALLAVLPDIAQQIKRDREEELCHRGTAYMRAIQRYYRKIGRYPTRLEDLDDTNNVRYLRKRYKDPMSRAVGSGFEQDFKLLHPQDIMLNNGPVTGQALGQLSLVGQSGPPTPALGSGQMAQTGGMQTLQSGLQNNGGNPDNTGFAIASASSPSSSTDGSGVGGQVFGGAPIIGVVSASKDKTIREYNNKNHYSDWYFIYVYNPNVPVQGLLVGPWQPNNMTVGGDAVEQPADGSGQQQVVQPATGLSQPGLPVNSQGSITEQNPNQIAPKI